MEIETNLFGFFFFLKQMAESVHSQITAVSWGFVSFTDNSFVGRPEVGHF